MAVICIRFGKAGLLLSLSSFIHVGVCTAMHALEQDVLTLLSSKRPLYQYQIVNLLNIGRPGKPMIQGALSRTMKRLQEQGYIRLSWIDEHSKGACRKYFQITEKGLKRLQQVSLYRETLLNATKINNSDDVLLTL